MQTATSPAELDLMAAARGNDAFRRVIETGQHGQVVLMTLPVGQDIGDEVHPDTDQLFIFVSSHGEAKHNGAADSARAAGNNRALTSQVDHAAECKGAAHAVTFGS